MLRLIVLLGNLILLPEVADEEPPPTSPGTVTETVEETV